MQNKQCKHYLELAHAVSPFIMLSAGNNARETTLRVQRVLASAYFSERAYSQTQASAEQHIWSRWPPTECHHRTSLHWPWWPSAVSYYILWWYAESSCDSTPGQTNMCQKLTAPTRRSFYNLEIGLPYIFCLQDDSSWARSLNRIRFMIGNPTRNIIAEVILRFEHNIEFDQAEKPHFLCAVM